MIYFIPNFKLCALPLFLVLLLSPPVAAMAAINPAPNTPNNNNTTKGKGEVLIPMQNPNIEISGPSNKTPTNLLSSSPEKVYKELVGPIRCRNYKRIIVKLVAHLLPSLLLLTCFICSLTVHGMKDKKFFSIELSRWFLLLLIIFTGMLAVHWIVSAIVFMVEWRYMFKRKNVVYFTYGLKGSLQVFIWICVVLITWLFLIRPDIKKTKRNKKISNYVTWTIASLAIGIFLWFIKTIMMKILATSFHLSRFAEKIHTSVFHHYVLQTLAGRDWVKLYGETKEEKISLVSSTEPPTATKTDKTGNMYQKIHLKKKKKVSFYTLKFLFDVFTKSGLSSMSSLLEETVVEGGVELDDGKISTEEEAVVAAVRIFRNVDKDNDKIIDREDLNRFMIPEEVDLVFPLFELDEEEQITMKAFCAWVVKVYKDRETLQLGLNDNKSAIKQLNKLLNFILIVLTVVLWLLVTGIATTKVLLFLSSQLVVAVFVFGNTCKNIFEAIIFVFVMHPFDVEDRVTIDGNTLIVEEMNILTTVFIKPDRQKIYYPNSALATKSIGNYFRSADQGDSLEFVVSFTTTLETIGKLKERIKEYLLRKEDFFYPEHDVIVNEIENINKIKMVLYFRHRMNFQDYAEKSRRRTELALELKNIFDKLDIKYNLLPQEIHLNKMTSI